MSTGDYNVYFCYWEGKRIHMSSENNVFNWKNINANQKSTNLVFVIVLHRKYAISSMKIWINKYIYLFPKCFVFIALKVDKQFL